MYELTAALSSYLLSKHVFVGGDDAENDGMVDKVIDGASDGTVDKLIDGASDGMVDKLIDGASDVSG
eukprot:CAMPEP_0201659150 /NCGR_PEP_ID=MMETSP0494-20130426/2006_1 /ASSEMBLY_ACC=CAM_ASM_000839 /TAXON_ID=420259 /ORGANISM="Thalassiosira gravida, Strain GMp14c1" /LENGTH=66 /DNA_ID=CAMNT_0048136541 /DNA_START=99 /DNA_END=295 /DNA_ORIENTATION=-